MTERCTQKHMKKCTDKVNTISNMIFYNAVFVLIAFPKFLWYPHHIFNSGISRKLIKSKRTRAVRYHEFTGKQTKRKQKQQNHPFWIHIIDVYNALNNTSYSEELNSYDKIIGYLCPYFKCCSLRRDAGSHKRSVSYSHP